MMTPDEALTPSQRRWDELPDGAPLDEYFAALYDVLREHYLAEPDNPYRQSGRGGGAERWEESRRCIADAVDRDGDLLDVGCANGLLLESMAGWLAERGITVRPHGVDFIDELVELARERLPEAPAGAFHAANVWDWQPPRRYDFVRTNLDYLPERYWAKWVRRHWERLVAPGGRLVLCWYYPSSEAGQPQPSPSRVLEEWLRGRRHVEGARHGGGVDGWTRGSLTSGTLRYPRRGPPYSSSSVGTVNGSS
jgi:SAM-dependent methyltransferase